MQSTDWTEKFIGANTGTVPWLNHFQYGDHPPSWIFKKFEISMVIGHPGKILWWSAEPLLR